MWSLAIKAFSFIPKQVWIYLAIITIAFIGIREYGSSQYELGVADQIASYKEASDKALNDDLRKVKEDLATAIAQAEKEALRASQTATEIHKYEEENKLLQDRISKLKSKDIVCRNISPEYHGVFDTIFSSEK